MKKSIILALALALPAMAGDGKYESVTVVDVPQVAATPATCPFAVEVAGVYNSMTSDINDYYEGVDTYGVDLTGVYKLNDNWSVTLRVGYATGSEDYYYPDGEFRTIHDEIELDSWSIMPGIRYTAAIGGGFSVFVGANVGVASYDLTLTEVGGDYSISGDDTGFAYSAELGVRYDVCENLYVFAAAQMNGCQVEASDGGEEPLNVGARVGLGWQF